MVSTLKRTSVVPLMGNPHPTPITLPKMKSPLIGLSPPAVGISKAPAAGIPKAPYIGKQVGV